MQHTLNPKAEPGIDPTDEVARLMLAIIEQTYHAIRDLVPTTEDAQTLLVAKTTFPKRTPFTAPSLVFRTAAKAAHIVATTLHYHPETLAAWPIKVQDRLAYNLERVAFLCEQYELGRIVPPPPRPIDAPATPAANMIGPDGIDPDTLAP